MQRMPDLFGKEFYLAASVSDLLASEAMIGDRAWAVLTNVSLRAIPEPPDRHGGTSQWYEVSDSSGKVDLYWPAMMWLSDASGLTEEMRVCGRFIAPTLLLRVTGFGLQIVKIIKRQRPAGKKSKSRGWFAGFLPAWAGIHQRIPALLFIVDARAC